jgi:hypothetical protein
MMQYFRNNALTLLNQSINVFWTVIFFAPVLAYWISYYDLKSLLIILGLGIIPYFIPFRFFNLFQLSKSRRFYESVYIHQFQKITQNGAFIKRLQSRVAGKPNFKQMRDERKGLLNNIAIYEKYHWSCLVIFIGTTFFAAKQASWRIALIISVANVFYNITPILIQQYNKSRHTHFKNYMI